MSMESLGLTDEQERLYRYLLRHPQADLEAAGVELVLPAVRPVLAELRALSLVDGTLTALAPAAAIEVLVRRRIEQQVLRALTCHDNDEAAARSISVSVRKFRAHVAELMARLDAGTRFQAALRAKERGWL
jgi:DNA-binding NarL/FixJ family response regulator